MFDYKWIKPNGLKISSAKRKLFFHLKSTLVPPPFSTDIAFSLVSAVLLLTWALYTTFCSIRALPLSMCIWPPGPPGHLYIIYAHSNLLIENDIVLLFNWALQEAKMWVACVCESLSVHLSDVIGFWSTFTFCCMLENGTNGRMAMAFIMI